MFKPGQIALVKFKYSDNSGEKLRPVLILKQLPNYQDDLLVCMISSQLFRRTELDNLIDQSDKDFISSGLKTASIIRITRIAVTNSSLLIGSIGEISSTRLDNVRKELADWLLSRNE